MREIVVIIPANQIEEGDEILVPLTVPPTRLKVWKVFEVRSSGRIDLSFMEGDDNWHQTFKPTDLLQVIR